MRTPLPTMLAAAMALVACGGDDDSDAGDNAPAETGASEAGASDEAEPAEEAAQSDDAAADASGGAVVDAPPAGSVTATLDGLDLVFDVDLGGTCSISDDSITFGFAADDDISTVAAGMNRSDGDWQGSILIKVPRADGGEGLVQYDPMPVDGNTLAEGSVAVEGSSMSYSGPIRRQPPNDGSNPPPVAAGEGTISATC